MAKTGHWLVALDCRHMFALRGVVVIGRAVGCDIRLNDLHVSRRHCELRPGRGEYRLVDLGARNGVFVNGRRVYECGLHDEDVIRIGHRRFAFKIAN
jgi:pSer/pThr/pTyr-binding forkhead associated (FHA) protein